MNVGTFKTLVRNTAKRGTTLDDVLDTTIVQAGQFLERNYEFNYMKRFGTFTLNTASDNPRAITLWSQFIRSIDFMRIVRTDGTYGEIRPCDPKDVKSTKTAEPTRFWIDGVDYVWFDNTPGENYNGEVAYTVVSDWETDVANASAEPWLLKHGIQAMLAQTMIMLGPQMRSQQVVDLFTPLRLEGVQVLLNQNEDLVQKNQDVVMQYGRVY